MFPVSNLWGDHKWAPDHREHHGDFHLTSDFWDLLLPLPAGGKSDLGEQWLPGGERAVKEEGPTALRKQLPLFLRSGPQGALERDVTSVMHRERRGRACARKEKH